MNEAVVLIVFAAFVGWLLFAKTMPGSSWQGYTVDHSKITVKDRLISLGLFCGACVAGLAGKIIWLYFLGVVAIGWLFLKKK